MTGRVEFLREYKLTQKKDLLILETTPTIPFEDMALTNGKFSIQNVAYIVGIKHILIIIVAQWANV